MTHRLSQRMLLGLVVGAGLGTLAHFVAPDRRYVLYCEFGLKSAHLAERMRRHGFDASNFRGGLRALVAHARERRLGSPDLLG